MIHFRVAWGLFTTGVIIAAFLRWWRVEANARAEQDRRLRERLSRWVAMPGWRDGLIKKEMMSDA